MINKYLKSNIIQFVADALWSSLLVYITEPTSLFWNPNILLIQITLDLLSSFNIKIKINTDIESYLIRLEMTQIDVILAQNKFIKYNHFDFAFQCMVMLLLNWWLSFKFLIFFRYGSLCQHVSAEWEWFHRLGRSARRDTAIPSWVDWKTISFVLYYNKVYAHVSYINIMNLTRDLM